MQRFLTVGEAAAFLGCCTDTVRRLADHGKLPAKRDYKGHRRFSLADLQALKVGREVLR